jgi:hypothetical protein
MSFYIEIKNWDKFGPKTFLVQHFNAASRKKGGLFSGKEADPEATYVEFENERGGAGGGEYTIPAVGAVIFMPYEDFKRELVTAHKLGVIPSFDKRD